MDRKARRYLSPDRRFRSLHFHADTPPESLKATVKLIGHGIKESSKYLPLRQHAAALASRAGPKDYLGQAKAIFHDFTRRWRYVKDPRGTELVTISPQQVYGQVLGFGAHHGRGFGDCDDATVALGALYRSVGFDTRINTIAPLKYSFHRRGLRQPLFTHVYPSIFVPKVGWISADAVGYPAHGLGWTPPSSRVAQWSLSGALIAAQGHLPPEFKTMVSTNVDHELGRTLKPKGDSMSLAGVRESDFEDYGLHRYGLAGTDRSAPADWSTYGQVGFGALVDSPVPIINSDRMGLMMEYDDEDTVAWTRTGQPLVRTKMMEMAPKEIAYAYRYGQPRPGAVALSDDGEFYEWQQTPVGGFFSKIFSRVKKGVKKVAGKVKGAVTKGIKFLGSKAKALIKRLPGGKYLLKIYDRIKGVAMKLVKPLMKFVSSKLAKRIAPIAALIPGYGPIISAALYKAQDIAKLVDKFGVKIKDGKPTFKSGKQAKEFRGALSKRAKQMAKRSKKEVEAIAKGKKGKKRKSKKGAWYKKGAVRGYDGFGYQSYWN